MTLPAILTAIHAVDGVLTWPNRNTEQNPVARIWLAKGKGWFLVFKLAVIVVLSVFGEWCQRAYSDGLLYGVGIGFSAAILAMNLWYLRRRKK